MILKKCPNTHPDFITLTRKLDDELNQRYGKAQVAYITHNRIDPIDTAMMAYEGEVPVGCGCFKAVDYGEADGPCIEIKRMFVVPDARGRGTALALLTALEAWAGEMGYLTALLETGSGQPEAIGLYKKAGYTVIPNYGPYQDMDNSICMKKEIPHGPIQ